MKNLSKHFVFVPPLLCPVLVLSPSVLFSFFCLHACLSMSMCFCPFVCIPDVTLNLRSAQSLALHSLPLTSVHLFFSCSISLLLFLLFLIPLSLFPSSDVFLVFFLLSEGTKVVQRRNPKTQIIVHVWRNGPQWAVAGSNLAEIPTTLALEARSNGTREMCSSVKRLARVPDCTLWLEPWVEWPTLKASARTIRCQCAATTAPQTPRPR